MIRTTALALALMAFAGPGWAEAGLRPLSRPAEIDAVADPSFAPANDRRPLVRPAGLTATGIDLTLVSFAPPRGTRPLARPRTEDPSDPFMMVAVQDATALPQRAPAAAPAAVPLVLSEAPVLPASPLAVVAGAAPPTGNEVLTAVSTASQMPVPALLRPRLRPEAVTRNAPAAVTPDLLLAAGPMGNVVRIMPVAARIAPQFAPLSLTPQMRPEGVTLAAIRLPAPKVLSLSPARSIRPEPRPELRTAQRAAKAAEPEAEVIRAAVVRPLPGKEGIVGKKGSVCGDPSIKGQVIPPIASRVKGCGVAEPVRITSVAGVKLSEAATIDCNTARALTAWVDRALQPQFASDPVVQLQVAGHYVCRPRNNIKGNKISEHGKGKAIDISGFVLSSGELVTVAGDWHSKGDGKRIRAAHKAACGVFNTTLGPGSDGYHEDHMHFDTAAGRGPYCH